MATLLLNYVYYNPAGHVAEALKFARGFQAANPELEVHLLLNNTSPWELAAACEWLTSCRAIDTDLFLDDTAGRAALEALPREWDYVVTNDWILNDLEGRQQVARHEAGMAAFHRAAKQYFRARRGSATVDYPVAEWLGQLRGLEYDVDAYVRLPVPETAREFARDLTDDTAGPNMCVLLGGSFGQAWYPSARSWVRILRALRRPLPGLRLYLTGARRPAEGRTHTEGYTDADIAAVLAGVPGLVDCYDVGLSRQLALIERCDLFLSPHTGFGFVAQCVGTPWLVLSGGHYCEGNFHNGVPWYSVLPDDPAYPYLGASKHPLYPRRPKIPSMRAARIEKRIPDVVDGARLLLDPQFTFEAAIQRHADNWARANVRQDVPPHGPRY